MRCCKDLGVASELWYENPPLFVHFLCLSMRGLTARDPRFIRKFKKERCAEVFTEHVMTKKTKKLWRRKGDEFEYPYKEKTSFK